MTTIDQVIQANEDLSLAIEAYSSACKPMKLKGMSLALEEAQGDNKEQAKKTVFERLRTFIKRIIDWALGLFKKNKEKQKENIAKMDEGRMTYDEMLAKCKPYEQYKSIGMNTIGPAVRKHMLERAIAMLNDDPACILMMRAGGPFKFVEEARRYAKNMAQVFNTFTIGLENIVEGKQYRQGIEYIGFCGQVSDARKAITKEEYPSMLRYDRLAARKLLIDAVKKFPEFDLAIAAVEDFQKKAEALLKDVTDNGKDYHPDDIAQLRKDIVEYVPDTTRGLKNASENIYSAMMSAHEINQHMYGGKSTVHGIPNEELAVLMEKIGKGDLKKATDKDLNGILNYVALLIGPEFEIMKG